MSTAVATPAFLRRACSGMRASARFWSHTACLGQAVETLSPSMAGTSPDKTGRQEGVHSGAHIQQAMLNWASGPPRPSRTRGPASNSLTCQRAMGLRASPYTVRPSEPRDTPQLGVSETAPQGDILHKVARCLCPQGARDGHVVCHQSLWGLLIQQGPADCVIPAPI